MTNEQILKASIEKAVGNGYMNLDYKPYIGVIGSSVRIGDGRLVVDDYSIYSIIFSHDFAKAFWGEEMLKDKIITNAMNFIPIEKWKWNLQQMALEPEPLKYLEKFL